MRGDSPVGTLENSHALRVHGVTQFSVEPNVTTCSHHKNKSNILCVFSLAPSFIHPLMKPSTVSYESSISAHYYVQVVVLVFTDFF